MRHCLHTLFAAVAALLSAVGALSCADDMYDNSPDEPLKLSVDTILVNNVAQSVTIGVTARDAGWTLEGVEPWCTVTPASGEKGVTQVTVTFAPNFTEEADDNPDTPDPPAATDRTAKLTFRSGGAEKSVAVEQLALADIPLPHEHPDAAANKLIHAELAEWYFNGEPATEPADYNQSYDDFYFNYLSHLKRNENEEGNTWATGNERFIYSRIERNPAGTAKNPSAPRLNYGMEFEMLDFSGTFAARVLYVEPGSPAERAGLRRGDWFRKYNDTLMGNWTSNAVPGFSHHYQRYVHRLVHPVAGERTRLGMLTFRATGGGQLLDEGKEVTITPALHPNNPIIGPPQLIEEERLEAQGGGMTYTGYLMYNNFDPQWSDLLTETFSTRFANRPAGEELQNFILDLRYNTHGTVEMAELMGNLLVGNVVAETEEGEYTVAGKTFAEYTFNDAARNRTATFEAHPDGIAPRTVFILTSRHTAGAAELLINALRGLDQQAVKLIVVGEVTQGLAAGMVKRTVPDPVDPSREYSAWMLAFLPANQQGQGGYTWGLVPNSEVNELERGDNIKWSTTWEWKGRDGSTEDPLIKRAVDIIKGRQLTPSGTVGNAAKSSRTGYPREFCFPVDMTASIN